LTVANGCRCARKQLARPVKHLDHISEEKIADVNVTTGSHWVCEFDDDLKPLRNYYFGNPGARLFSLTQTAPMTLLAIASTFLAQSMPVGITYLRVSQKNPWTFSSSRPR